MTFRIENTLCLVLFRALFFSFFNSGEYFRKSFVRWRDFCFDLNGTTAGWHKNNHHVCRINKIPATANKMVFERWTLSALCYLILISVVVMCDCECVHLCSCERTMVTEQVPMCRTFPKSIGRLYANAAKSQLVTIKLVQAVQIQLYIYIYTPHLYISRDNSAWCLSASFIATSDYRHYVYKCYYRCQMIWVVNTVMSALRFSNLLSIQCFIWMVSL